MQPDITSTSNPKIKNLVLLQKPRERKKQQLFLIEGVKEIGMAAKAGYELESVYYCEQIISKEEVERMLLLPELRMISVSGEVFDKIAMRESSGGVVAVAKTRPQTLNDLQLGNCPLVLVLESVEKPGNLGAILRTADAAGVDAVIICDPLTDFYNPNVIRSSVGCVFTNQITSASSEETIQWLKKHNVAIYCTYLQASSVYYKTDFTLPSAIVMGTEATGLSDLWVKNATANIIIPMKGAIDSMNVSTSAAVVIFEAIRQRDMR
ncbi:MAG: RNA methyltransferase [Bacteroidia bacterium]|nr:RNA methyltransferase [Bacteroidia bacterium]